VWAKKQTDARKLAQLQNSPQPSGDGLRIKTDAPSPETTEVVTTKFWQFQAIRTGDGHATDQIGLILPTSLCAGQIARMTAERLNQKGLGRGRNLSRFVALAHTEGCGVSSGPSEQLYTRTMLGYLTHPLVKHCLLLEHGCEKTHNDFMRYQIEQMGLNSRRLGWASIQLDGGIEKVMQKIEAWFSQEIAAAPVLAYETVGLEKLRLGVLNAGCISEAAAQSLAQITRAVVGAGGTVIVPQNAGLLSSNSYLANILDSQPVQPTLAYGQGTLAQGFHIMETPTQHWVETLTGLGAAGVEIILAYIGEHPMQSHPLIPVLQVTAEEGVQARYGDDLDLILSDEPTSWSDQLLGQLVEIASRRYIPKLYRQGNIDFQFTRGLLGISL
jgi:altronate dehydratase